MKVNIRDIIGSDAAVTYDLGVKVRESYGDKWRFELISLDFDGIRSISPSFLSQSVSPIIREYPLEEVPSHLHFSNVPPSFDLSWQKVREAVSRQNADGVNRS
jgi:hypothetical protein